MKVLFVRSGNKGIDPISTNQGNSLIREGLEVGYFDIIGRGIPGYLSNILRLRKYIGSFRPDILHAHYAISGFIAPLSGRRIPVGVSLMGSEIHSSGRLMKYLIKCYTRFGWDFTIVKSSTMYDSLKYSKAVIIPNGVNLEAFCPIDMDECREKLGWDKNSRHILFASDPERPEKNFELARQALELLEKENVGFKLHFLKDIPQSEMVYYFNAADVLLMTSRNEGSPNVIKEAMACNCPIITTNVGDVKSTIGSTRNTFITNYSASEIKDKLLAILSINERTDGRANIRHLESRSVANRLIELYQKALNHD